MTQDSSPAAWPRQARSCPRDADPVLARLIGDPPDLDPRAWLAQLRPLDLFGALPFRVTGPFQVTGQQLSVAAASVTEVATAIKVSGCHLVPVIFAS